MGRVKKQKVSSFFTSTKARARSQETKNTTVSAPTAEQSISSRTRQSSKATKTLLKPINNINNVKKSRTVKKGSKLDVTPAEKTDQTTLDSFISNKRKVVVKDKTPRTKPEQKSNVTLDTYINKKRKQDNIVAKQKDISLKENTPVKRASKQPSKSDTARRRRALIERVRAKGQKTLEETLQGMNPEKRKQKAMLSRAREFAKSLSYIYIQRNKTVMLVKEAALVIIESSELPISEYEAIEYIELLTKIAPKWCQFSTSKIENDLLIINTSMLAREVREIFEEGRKNFMIF